MNGRFGRARSGACACAAMITMWAAPAMALSPDEIAPLLSQIPPDVLSFDSQSFDADTGLTLTGVTLVLPGVGTATADSLVVHDLDVAGLMQGTPTVLDLAAAGVRIDRAGYQGDLPWPFADDVLTGSIAWSFRFDSGRPAYAGGALLIDFGENGRLASEASLAEPPWYPDPAPDQRLPGPGERLLPLAWTFELSNVTLAGDMLAALSDGAWQGGDVTLAIESSYLVDAGDQRIVFETALRSNLAELDFSAAGVMGALLHEEFGPNMRSRDSAIDFIDWSGASFSYRDSGLADAVLSAVFVASGEQPFAILADALEELGNGSAEVGADGPTHDAFAMMRTMLLNYGSYTGDALTVSVRPIVPVSFAVLDDVRVDPDSGLHPDDFLRLLRARFQYMPN